MLIKVKAFPESRKQEIIKKSDNSFEIKIKAKAEKGKANEEIVKVLSRFLHLPENRIKLIRGKVKRNKIFKIIEH